MADAPITVDAVPLSEQELGEFTSVLRFLLSSPEEFTDFMDEGEEFLLRHTAARLGGAPDVLPAGPGEIRMTYLIVDAALAGQSWLSHGVRIRAASEDSYGAALARYGLGPGAFLSGFSGPLPGLVKPEIREEFPELPGGTSVTAYLMYPSDAEEPLGG